jgi:hypothetical protein
MSDAFAKYTAACDRMERAESAAGEAIGCLSRALAPLFGTSLPHIPPPWKRHYLTGLSADIPVALVRQGGPSQARKPLDVSSISADLQHLHHAMVDYAEAEQDAAQAYQEIPENEAKRIGPPPWRPR